MDPDATLHMLRDLARRLLDATDDPDMADLGGEYGDDVANMAELFQHLDRWIIRKGALPEAWKPRDCHGGSGAQSRETVSTGRG